MTAIFQVGHLERVPLGVTYVAIVHHVGRLLASLPKDTDLCIDYTGIGRPVYDLFRYSGIFPAGVLITGGHSEAEIDGVLHVPKVVLVSRVQALLHEGRLKIQKDLPEAQVLVGELMDFRVSYSVAGHMAFAAREGRHDDLVFALGLASYRAAGGGERYGGLFEYLRRQAAPEGLAAPRYFVGVDLGAARDPTAIAVVRRVEGLGAAEVRVGYLPEAGPSLSSASVLHAPPFSNFQAASGARYSANEDGEIEVSDPDDRADLLRAGCTAEP